MAEPACQPDKVLTKNRKFFNNLLLTELLKSELMEKRVFKKNTIEELFMVSTNVSRQRVLSCGLCMAV